MKDQVSPTRLSIIVPSTTASPSGSPITGTGVKRVSSAAGLFGIKTGYKFWVLAAIILLAIWSMFTGSVTLKWSSGVNLITPFSNHINFPLNDDIDILEVEEREKVVRHMWDVYTHSSSVRLPRFWLDAFEAAYEYLVSDLPGVREAAVSEIAKLSIFSVNLDPFPHQSQSLKTQEKQHQEHWKEYRGK
ncbi:DUF1195 domain-containing protein [Cephalotus follicularis]|uniref:DUF1195 domain-containing protein n=1 Tax=Cephalotus follicularis TaxID=3775 RepID=A0A1Q3BQU8_CEPFO|nr:DUF1195 domain-containing protein [Cephalotus follicularis]